ncbi:MAG TPA: hypothetical protein VN541_03720, partial [Tepidisphaeraceae bacterium]|nr:hypothetical protein [Tepidisphaeraceae bacterium]
TFKTLEIGRGRWVVDVDFAGPRCRLTLWHYQRPLRQDYPNWPLVRFHGVGWFVDNYRISGIGWLGFAAAREGADYEYTHVTAMTDWYLQCPLWFLVLATALLPGWSLVRLRLRSTRKKQQQRGCCPICGYDLRATPSRCPECGHAVDDNMKV